MWWKIHGYKSYHPAELNALLLNLLSVRKNILPPAKCSRYGKAARNRNGLRTVKTSHIANCTVLGKAGSARLAFGDDTVSLSAGERVPADLRLIEAQDLFVSQALLTGESNVLGKNTNRLASATQIPLDRFSNIAFMGSSVISGEGKGIVLAVGGSTVYGGYLSELQRNKHSFDTGANSIAWVLIRFMVALVPVVFVVSGITKGDWLTSFLFSLSVAVGLTPELLPMVINACLAKGSSAMGEKQTIVKNINAMQSFGSMDVLCVDKTGTLTGDEVILEYYLDILGEESREVLDCAYLNSFYHTGVANHLDQAILKCSSMPGRENHFLSLGETIQKLDELPFDYERKCGSCQDFFAL